MKIKDQLALQKDMKTPWEVWRLFGHESKTIRMSGNSASLTDKGDYGSLEELQLAVAWYVDQLGGSVNWEKKDE